MNYALNCEDYLSAMRYFHRRNFKMSDGNRILHSSTFNVFWLCPPEKCYVVISVDYIQKKISYISSEEIKKNPRIINSIKDVKQLRKDILNWKGKLNEKTR